MGHLKDYANLGGVESGRGPHPWYPAVPDYNDYNAEGAGGPRHLKVKSDRIYEFAMGMLERKVPIDGVGFQFHIQLEKERRPSVAGIKANIQRFADLGLEVHITEMDIKVSPPRTEAKNLEQAKLYAEVLHACWSVSKCTAFIVGGLRDAGSWLLSRENVALLSRQLAAYALPFDEKYRPKLAVPYMIHVMLNKGVSWTSVDASI